MAALQTVQGDSVARLTFRITKAKPAAKTLLPRSAAAAASKPIRVLVWGRDFRTYRTLSSAPGSGIQGAVRRDEPLQQGQAGSSNIRMQVGRGATVGEHDHPQQVDNICTQVCWCCFMATTQLSIFVRRFVRHVSLMMLLDCPPIAATALRC